MANRESQVNEKLDRIRQRIALDVPLGVAIAIELGGSIPKWAATKVGISRVEASMTINAVRTPQPKVVSELAADLDCTEGEILELLGEGAKQRALAMAV